MKNSDFLNKILKNNNTEKKNDENLKIPKENNLKTNNLPDPIDKILDIEDLKYYSDERILKFTNGYENNNYIILSIIHDKFEVFKYLFKERNLDLKFKNSNGWNIIHFIIFHKRISK